MKKISKNIFNLKSVDEYSDIFLHNSPYPHIVIDNFLSEETANKALSSFELNENWINCSLVNNCKKYQLTKKNFMNETCNQIFDELASKEWIDKVKKITKINDIFLDTSLDGGGLHQIFNNGHLNIHTDFNSHTTNKSWRRVLNILIYLNKDWKEEYNGNLELWDEKVQNNIKSIPPIFNRCVIFKTDKKIFHGHPEKLKLPSNMSRKSIAAYYYVDEKKDLELYSTFLLENQKIQKYINF